MPNAGVRQRGWRPSRPCVDFWLFWDLSVLLDDSYVSVWYLITPMIADIRVHAHVRLREHMTQW